MAGSVGPAFYFISFDEWYGAVCRAPVDVEPVPDALPAGAGARHVKSRAHAAKAALQRSDFPKHPIHGFDARGNSLLSSARSRAGDHL
ncbi:MAG: hypothetical protein HUU21_16955 [Polyangiaceae bacterium]|nr:hypothetical protein [Polyangiaceae bacterium]